MPRFFVTSDQIQDGHITVRGDDAHHISRALRMAAGEHITVCDSAANEYECTLTEFLPDCVRCEILTVKKQETEPPCKITLYQALPKGDKFDLVIQKSVECGASLIVPFESARCIVRAKPEAEQKKRERRLRIAQEAAKQCGRGVLPEVKATVGFEEMLSMAKKADLVLFCFEGEGTVPISRILSESKLQAGQEIALIIGSEGGFSLAEAQEARAAGFRMTGLGKRILRTETAPIFALACVSAALELQ
ncbi:MAG: 16S rRNA (uracil(1498)-N(3))-methyltransferase [Clostridia bacterium]|nr:16S rRNA (uracil(1498)-N(3))-methyltransferase [Clostridia bacterium]